MTRAAALGAAAAVLALTACAPPPSVPRLDLSQGYLADAALERLAEAVPPPPAPGSPADLADRAASDAYRGLEGGDRWLLAVAHAEVRPPLALQHFDCALDVRLGSSETPALDRLMARVFHDADAAAEQVKARAFRARPVGDDPDRRACQRIDAKDRASPSYPSGSAALGAAYGQVFAALAPERAAAVRRIGHEMAVSRVVCAMHYPSDAQAGEALGIAVADAVAATPAFRADAAAARAELAAARATGRRSPACAAERLALSAVLPG